MTNFNDSFGRETIVEVLPSMYNKRVGFIIRRERQSLYESWDLTTAEQITEELLKIIKLVKEG